MFSVFNWFVIPWLAILPNYPDSFHATCTLSIVFLGCVYHGGDVNTAHPSCTQTAKRKPVIVCGDLNVAATPLDLKNPNANRHNAGYTDEEREKFAGFLKAGFVDTFRHLHPDEVKYSWWSYMRNARANNAGWRIDYFLMSEWAKDAIRAADIHTDIYGSDHCPVSLEVDI